jgi:hypothetical protein
MLRSPDDVPGWISPEYGGGGGSAVIGGGWWRNPSVDDVGFDVLPGRISPPPPVDRTLNPDPATTGVQPSAGTATQNDVAESIDANFVLIGAAVVLGVILLTTGKD